MKIGKLVSRPLRPALCYSHGNGSGRAPTRKTWSRKLSSVSGGETTNVRNRGLLYATVRSVALDLLRRDSRRARREADSALESDQTIEPNFDFDDESQRILAAAIDHLPREQREVLVMKIWNDLTFAEIAEALGDFPKHRRLALSLRAGRL